ncbi:MAG TPA: DUF92 domain-containing protein [Vicinamibacterales bacterium]|nr:DUF92 domain-containing protein [Vicinamibacterales bacterium]
MTDARASHSETARQWVHVGSGLFALLLRVLNGWQAATLAFAALVFNALLLPRLGGKRLYRPVDHDRGFPLGILLYPLSVLMLTLAFPTRLDIAAAAWGVLAFGDGFATLVGRSRREGTAVSAVPSDRIPWNPDKSWAGTIAFVVCGGLAAVALAWWTRPSIAPLPPMAYTIAAPLAAAVIAAFVETIPIRLDDNISVPLAAAIVLWLGSLMTSSSLELSHERVLGTLPWALGVNVVTGWLGYRAKTVSMSGFIGGVLVGTIIYACGGASAWVLLLATFIVASVASRLGLARKQRLGIAEERGGRRGAGNALANCGVAVMAAIAAATTPYAPAALAALVAALTAGGSDTVASEIGKAWGRSTFLVTTFGRVKAGTPGAMSLQGTIAGVLAALGLAAAGTALGLIAASAIVIVVISATAGALVESALGATLEGPGILNNDMLNFINTAVAAVVALVLL